MVKAYQSFVYPLPLYQLDKIFDKKKIEEHQELAGLFSKNAFEQLHNWQPTTKNRKVAKSIAHGVIGELAARMAGNVPGSGFKVIMTNELLIGEIKKVAKHDPVLAQWLSAAVGGVVNKVNGDSVNTGATVAAYATKWNEARIDNPVAIGQSATSGALDYRASSVTGRPTPVGSVLNYASMIYESSNIDKYGLEGAMSRVSMDLAYSSGMLVGGAYLGPVEAAGAGYLLDYGYNLEK